MKEEFLSKINSSKYISNLLYTNIKNEFPDIIPTNFDIDEHNDKVLQREYLKYKDYFENMYKGIDDNIILDEEQIKAILADEDYSLIIAGAGTGKTTTMAAKVKYLVDIKGVHPSKIVVMSFTKKATEELEQRIIVDFGIDCLVTTFHSLGYRYIKEIFKNHKCYVVDDNLKNEIFLDYFKNYIFPYKDKVKEIIDLFVRKDKTYLFGNYFLENYDKFETYDEFLDTYKTLKYNEIENPEYYVNSIIESKNNQESIYTINGELVKSKGEAIIANFLYCNGIDYKYEKIYDEMLDNNRISRPDFTLELGGEKIYIEYFGLSNYKDNLNRYNKIKEIKENYHLKHHNKFIKIDYLPSEKLERKLHDELIKFGFQLKPRSTKEIYFKLLEYQKISQIYKFQEFLYDVINSIKSSIDRENYKKIVVDYLNGISDLDKEKCEKQFNYINDFYLYYNSELLGHDNYGFDFSDMIFYANKYIKSADSEVLNFDYIIIDEYQDISSIRYEFTKKITEKNKSKVVAVGDDWQSIYAFSGSKIRYIYDFEKYFEGAKLLKITKTYRNSQNLIEYSRNFIMKNPDQIDKELISNKELNNPIKFKFYEVENIEGIDYNKLKNQAEYNMMKETILKIHSVYPTHNILILARNNNMINNMFEDKDLKDEVGTKIKFLRHSDIDIDAMTIHKSKGLTSDEVIVIGLDKRFPSDEHNDFWLKMLFKNKKEIEKIAYAEERRLFYVALTRTKNYVFLIANKDSRYRSPFINEIYDITKEEVNV